MKFFFLILLCWQALISNGENFTIDEFCWTQALEQNVINIYSNLTIDFLNNTECLYWLQNDFNLNESNSSIVLVSYEFDKCISMEFFACDGTFNLSLVGSLDSTVCLIGNRCEPKNETLPKFKTSIGIEKSNILCSTTCLSNSSCEANGTLRFHTESNEEIYNETFVFGQNVTLKSSILAEEIWSKHFNKNIYCEFNSENETSRSEDYYLGIILLVDNVSISANNQVLLYEDRIDGTTLIALSNIPLKCTNSSVTNCDIKLYIEPMSDFFTVKTDDGNCFSSLKPNKLSTYLTLQPEVYVENLFLKDLISLDVSVKVLLSGLNLSVSFPTLKITYIPNNRQISRGGSCYNDPHCSTNDGQFFEFQYYDGEYLMYENREFQFRVHLVSRTCVPNCNSCNYCIKEIYIQSIDDFIAYDVDKTPKIFYKDLSFLNKSDFVPLIWSNNSNQAILSKTTLFSIFQDAYHYNIFSHFGTAIRIAKQGYFFQITPSKVDLNKVNGLLGDYNQNANDDFGETRNMSDFFMKFNVIENKLPQMSKGEFYNFTKQTTLEKTFCSCVYVSEKGTFEETCKNGPMRTNKFVVKDKIPQARSQLLNNEITTNDINYLFQFNKTKYQSPIELKKSNTSNCHVILNDTVLNECHQRGIINTTKLFEDCEIDFKSTNLTIWAEYYVETRRGWCKTNYEDDITISGSMTQQKLDSTLSALCFNNCINSTHGTCINGKCFCNQAYAGDDCSIDVRQPPNLVATTRNDNKCDKSKETNCNVISLFGSGFSIDRESLRILYKPIGIINASLTKIDVLSIDHEIIVGKRQLVQYKLPTNKISVRRFSLSVTNGLENATSNELEYTIFDSKCHLSSVNGEFSLKVNTCDIDDACYTKSEKNPTDSNKECDPSRSLFTWSTSIGLRVLSDIYFLHLLLILVVF